MIHLAQAWRVGRLLLGLCAVALMAWTASARADTGRGTWQVLEGLPASTTIEAAAALPAGAWQAVEAKRSYRVSIEAPLWLRFVPPAASAGLMVEFPTIVVDRYEMFQRRESGAWQMQAAGDRVPHTEWPMPSLRPRFELQPAAPGAEPAVVYVRVEHRLPLSVAPRLVSPEVAQAADRRALVLSGVSAGFMLTLMVLCLQMSLAFRDSTYGWYAAYLLSTGLAALCYTGAAHLLLWPGAAKWASDAVVLGVVGALAFNLQFTRHMFGGFQKPWFHWVARGLMVLCVAYLLHTLLTDRYERVIGVFNLVWLGVFGFTVLAAWQAWRAGVAYGGLWLLIYTPYVFSLGFSLAASVGWLPMAWLPDNTPVITSIIESVAMMLCINAYGRARHAQAVREKAAAERDPLTGFLNERRFRQVASRLWASGLANRRDVAMVYVKVEPNAASELGTVETEVLLARSVRLVRTVTRDIDAVGRIGRNTLGIAMGDMPPGEAFTSRLSRLVALGLMADPHDQAAVPVRFTLAVAHRVQQGDDFAAIDRELRRLCAQADEPPGERPARTIRVLPPVVTFTVGGAMAAGQTGPS
jgi:GGDEF domain-containing protein